MLKGLILKELKERFWYFAVSFAIFAISALTTPAIYKMTLTTLLLSNRSISFSDFIWANWCGQGLWELGLVLALVLGSSIYAQEHRHHTFPFILTRSASRSQVFSSKIITNLAILWSVVLGSTLLLLLSSLFSGIDLNQDFTFVPGSIFAALAFLYPFSLSVLTSTLLSSGLTGFGTAALWMAVDIWVLYSGYPHFSFIYYIVDKDLYTQTGFPWAAALIFTMLSCLFLSAAHYYFKKKEF